MIIQWKLFSGGETSEGAEQTARKEDSMSVKMLKEMAHFALPPYIYSADIGRFVRQIACKSSTRIIFKFL